MAIITEPMALDASFNTTETTPRSQADVLAGIEQAILQGMGRTANEVAYDNTTSGLQADDVQEAIDELAAEKVDKVSGKGLSTNDYTNDEKNKLAGIEAGAEVNVQSDWAQTDSNADDYIKNKQLVTEPIEELQNDVKSTQTATGNPITLTDASETYAQSLVVELEPVQDLHGQDAPYVGGAGKQKLPLTLANLKASNTSDGTWSGNTFTTTSGVAFTIQTDDGGNVTGIKANGTSGSTETLFVLYDWSTTILSDATAYTLNGCPANGSGNTYRIYVNNISVSASENDYANDFGSGVTFTTKQNHRTVCRISIGANVSVNNLVFYPMIRLATETDPTFAPYSNICPITGYTECEVVECGKNLIPDGTDTDKGYVANSYLNADGTTTSSYTSYISEYFTVKPSVAVVWKGLSKMFFNSGAICFYDSSKTYIIGYAYQQREKVDITIPANAVYCRSTQANDDNIDKKLQLEYGTQPTDYEPYHSSNATIQFGQTVYGGSSNFTDGGTESKFGNDNDISQLDWVVDNNDGLFRALVTSLNYKLLGILYCDRYKGVRKAASQMEYGEISATNSQSTLYLRIKDATAIGMDATQFKAHISGTQLTYELYELGELSTLPTDLKLLQGTNNLSTNGTTINLDYIPDNSIGDAVKASEEYTNRQVNREIEQHLEMPYLRILDNDVDTEIKNYQLYYRMIASAYTLVNLAEMLQHRFLFVEIIQNPSGTSNDKLLHSALIDPRTIDGFEYQMKAGTGDTVCIKTNIAENKLDLYVQSTGTHTSGDPTDYYVTIRMVD